MEVLLLLKVVDTTVVGVAVAEAAGEAERGRRLVRGAMTDAVDYELEESAS